MVGYQRPGDALQGTLETDFPMRPSLFFGPEELDSGSVRARVLTPEPFAGALFDPTGGLVVNGSIRLLVGSGDMAGRNAVELRPLSMGAFGEFTNSVLRAAAAFEVTLAGVAPGRRVDVQVAGLATNQLFLLARVVYANGEYGLQPVERLSSDGSGRLRSIEPPSAPRLAGLTGSGQYLLLQLSQPHGLVSGVVTRAAGTAASGLPVRVVGQPWLAFSGADGSWLLVAPPGRASLDVQDPITGNSGTATIEVKDPATAVATSLSLVVAGPRVVGVSPPDGATGVSRISPITVTFNKPVAAASFGAGALTLTGTNGIPIAAGISLNLAGTTATLLPSVQLAPGQAHQLAVSPAIKDLGGAGLEGPREFTFTTETDQLNRQLGQLVLTEPAGGIASMVGSSGTAEPGSQVILVNEATGFTTTVLAGTDGSFSNSIPASVDDPLSAVLLDRNGERTPLPASRQIHADGSVALFSGGGVLEAATPNGPMQVILEPGSIPTKTTFKIDVLPTTEVLTLVNNTPPEGGAVLGGFRFTMTGDPLTASADVSFPIDVSKLVLQPGELPTQRTFALCQPIEQDGVLVYSIIDRMHYEDGHLVTHSPPFPGLGATAAGAILAVPVMMAFGTQVAIAGKAVAVSDDAGLVSNEEVAQGFAVRGGVTYPMIPLAGATVSASPQTLAVLSTPALRPGAVVAHSSYSGAYALLFPNGSLDPDAILIRATHPRFPGMIGSAVVLPAASTEFQPGVIGNPLMRYHGNGSFLDQEAPTLSVSQDGVLLVGVPQVVHFNLRDNASAPMLTSATVVPGDSRALLTGLPLLSSDATIQVGSPHTTGTSSTSYDATVLARVAAIVAVDAVVDDQSGNMATNRIVLRIADPPPAGTNLVASSDPSDSIPPYVVSVNPVDGGIINHGEVVIRFSEPVDQTIVTDPSAVTITPPVPLTRVLSPTQTELLVQCGGLVEGQSYTVTLNSGIVRDLGGNSLGSSFVTRFLTPPSGVVIVPGTHKAVATLALGGVNFTLDQQNGDGALLADLPLGGTQSPTRLGILSLPPFPRAMELIPDYSYKRTTNGVVETKSLIAITGGLLGTGEVGQWLWIVDASNPTNLVRIASELASVDFTSALTAIKWSPPRLAILETRSEGSVIHHVNLQAFILGANGAAAGTPSPGVDANGDGDFVDPGDSLPVPTRGSFFGDEFTTEAPKRRVISDYGVAFGGSFEVAITPALGSAPAFFQVYYWEGMPFVPTSPNDG
ncbi:MAG TPA: hypothetical protein DCM86_09465, partial [Verrucomicrobiales bacterium]|nr:hypothetical protein [Verrucomicrobiales bacterium]